MSWVGADERQEALTSYRRNAEMAVLYYETLLEAGATVELALRVVGSWAMPQQPGYPSTYMRDMVAAMNRMVPPVEEDD